MDKFDEKIKDRGASRYVFPQRKFESASKRYNIVHFI